MYYIFTFNSRTNAINFYDALNRNEIKALLINTPKAARLGCGLSVKTLDYAGAKRILSYGGYSSFYGVFEFNPSTGTLEPYD